MVEGELFLGDVMLREEEFQFAPAGSEHGELFSDVGCLLFFFRCDRPGRGCPGGESWQFDGWA